MARSAIVLGMLSIIINQAALDALRDRLPREVAHAMIGGAFHSDEPGTQISRGVIPATGVLQGVPPRTNNKNEALMRRYHCPIPGCSFVYDHGAIGWGKHVGSLSNHYGWVPETMGTEERKVLFQEQFPDFFRDVRRVSTQPPSRPQVSTSPPIAQPVFQHHPPVPTSQPTMSSMPQVAPPAGLEFYVRQIVYNVLSEMFGGVKPTPPDGKE